MTTINLRELYEAVQRVLPRPTDAFSVKVEVWHYGTGDDPTIQVNIWDDERHYAGATPEEALAKFMASHPRLAAVEAVEVPE